MVDRIVINLNQRVQYDFMPHITLSAHLARCLVTYSNPTQRRPMFLVLFS